MRSMRVAVAAALAAVLMLPVAAVADPPVRFSERTLELNCFPPIVSGDGALTASVFASDRGFSSAFVFFWPEPPADEETPPLLTGESFDSAVVDGLSLSAEIPLMESFEPPDVGTASLEATLTPVGNPEPIQIREPGLRIEGTTQQALVSGSVELEAEGILDQPVSFDLSDCAGMITDVTVRENLPDTARSQIDLITMACQLNSGDGDAGVFAFRFDFSSRRDDFGSSFLDIFVAPADPAESMLFGFTEDFSFTRSGLQASFPVFDVETEEELGTASIGAEFTVTETLRGRRVGQDWTEKVFIEILAVTGSLDVETETATYQFDLSDCEAEAVSVRGTFHDPSGPKPGGAVPANDTPDGALALTIGGKKFQQQTGGASIPPEEPCLIEFDDFVFEIPWGRTVWFTFTGTGDEITIDPAGSTFDTVVAAYVQVDDDLEQVGCVDDDLDDPLRNLQGPLTIATEAGVTYYVQIGGFDPGGFDGEPDPEFGRLRVVVY